SSALYCALRRSLWDAIPALDSRAIRSTRASVRATCSLRAIATSGFIRPLLRVASTNRRDHIGNFIQCDAHLAFGLILREERASACPAIAFSGSAIALPTSFLSSGAPLIRRCGRGFRYPAWSAKLSLVVWDLLRGAPTLTATGLSTGSLIPHDSPRSRLANLSGRTIPES